MKYTIKEFDRDFSSDDVCLEYIFNKRYGKTYTCPHCGKGNFYRVSTRKSYVCCRCGNQLYPVAGTIFHKSPTPLKSWFYSIFLMSQSRNGVSAKEIERQLGVTYKTAWRMQKQIRKLMAQHEIKMDGTVEVDETYIGGVRHGQGRGPVGKTPVLGIVERKGEIRTTVIDHVKTSSIVPLIKDTVKTTSNLITDELNIYKGRALDEYKNHDIIRHEFKEYVKGNIHTNTIEGFWSQLKRSITGTYHHVSRKYLQHYVDEFSYRYNRRESNEHLFFHLLSEVVERPC